MWDRQPLNLSIIEDYKASYAEDYKAPDRNKSLARSQSNLISSQLFHTLAIFDASHLGYEQVEIFTNKENRLLATLVDVYGVTTDLSEKEIFHSGYLTSLAVSDMTAKQRAHFINNVCYMKIHTIGQKHLSIW